MVTYVVSNANELHTALDGAASGDRIELTSGNYGDFFRRDTSFTSDVTITAQSADAPPVFDSINLWNVDHFAFDGIDIHFVPDVDTVETHSGFKASYSSHISIRNSEVTGGAAVNGIDPSSEAGTQTNTGINGYPIGRGLNFFNTTDILIENNEISRFTTGTLLSTAERVEMIGNTITETRKTPVNGSNLADVVLDGNTFSDVTPWKYGGLGDHGDFVHFWTVPNQERPSENFVFTNNQFLQGDGVGIMGIYLDDNTNDIGFQNVIITDNLIHTDNAQGLRLEDVRDGIINNNTLLQSAGDDRDSRDAPGFLLADGTENLVISDNILAGFNGNVGTALGTHNIQTTNNILVQLNHPMGENYIGNLFVNALTSTPSLADLRALPGTAVDGMGASVTQFDANSDAFQGYVAANSGTGLDLNLHAFTVFDGYHGLDADALNDVTFDWSFGDGTSATGPAVEHKYEEPGTYDVTVVMSHLDGLSETFSKVIVVETPFSVNTGFGTLDEATVDFNVLGDVSLVDSDYGKALRVGDNSSVAFETDDGLTGNSEFSISLGFKKDVGAEESSGRIMYFSGTAVVNLGEDFLTLRAKTDQGESIVLHASGLPVDNADWHQFTYTFSENDGTASLYLDGELVAEQTGLSGAQHITSGHKMHIGNPFGDGFDGLLDSATFVREAKNSSQVEQAYNDFMSSGSPLQTLTAEPDAHVSPAITAPQSLSVEAAVEIPQPTSIEEPELITSIDEMTQPGSDQIDLKQIGVAARVEREELGYLFDTDEFEISFTVSAGSNGAWGEVVRLHQGFIVELQEDGHLLLRTFSDQGELIRLISDKTMFEGQNTHEISIRLENGILSLGLDNTPGVATTMQGRLQDVGAHDLVFGNPWDRQNFDGELHNFDITVPDHASDLAGHEDISALIDEFQPSAPNDGMQYTDADASIAIEYSSFSSLLGKKNVDGMTFSSDFLDGFAKKHGMHIDRFERSQTDTGEDTDLSGV